MRPPPRLRHQALGDEGAERRRQPGADRLLIADVEGADDAVHGARRVDGVQGREHEVAGFGGGQRDLHRFAVAHLADEDHLRRLPQRRPQGQRERRRVAVQLALVHGALLVLVEELHRVFDGDDVLGAGLVDEVDHRGERRRLARAGRAGHQHDAALERGDLGQGRRQAEILQGRHLGGDHAHHDRERAALAEDVDAKAGAVARDVRQVARPLVAKGAHRLRLPPTRWRAMRAVWSAVSVARPETVTGVSSPCCSTCGGRPGENTRSLIPSPESSIRATRASVGKAPARVLRAEQQGQIIRSRWSWNARAGRHRPPEGRDMPRGHLGISYRPLADHSSVRRDLARRQ